MSHGLYSEGRFDPTDDPGPEPEPTELEELRAALYRAGDLLFGTWDDDLDRAQAMRKCEREIRTLIGERRMQPPRRQDFGSGDHGLGSRTP